MELSFFFFIFKQLNFAENIYKMLTNKHYSDLKLTAGSQNYNLIKMTMAQMNSKWSMEIKEIDIKTCILLNL